MDNDDGASSPIKGGIFYNNQFGDQATSLPFGGQPEYMNEKNVKAEEDHLFKRAGAFIEYGNEVEPDMKSSKALQFKDPPLFEETDDEDNVYPLSIKYNRKKA
jgi:hypothetical protein